MEKGDIMKSKVIMCESCMKERKEKGAQIYIGPCADEKCECCNKKEEVGETYFCMTLDMFL